MTARKRPTPNQDTLQNDILEGTEVAENAPDKIIEFESDAKESIEKLKVESPNLKLKIQMKQLKQDMLKKLEVLKQQFGFSQKEYMELKLFVKTEFNTVICDLSQLSKELKADVTELSSKHKDHLVVTFKRSKDNTMQAWKKVTPVKSVVVEKSA